MKLMKRIKDILFDEEEVEIPVIEKETKKDFIQEVEEQNSITEIKIPDDDFSDKESLKSELTFPFPIEFDEDELEKTKPIEEITKRKEPESFRTSNYSRYEEKKERPQREIKDYSSYLKTKDEKKQFKPTPIISPVYGVLDQNYKKEDLVVRGEPVKRSALDPKPELDDILKKAYGETSEIEDTKEIEVIEEDVIIDPNKTIGELIEEEISIENNEMDNNIVEDEPSVELNSLIEEKEEIEKKLQITEDDEDDTDLFSLIDSMYEENNRE